MRRSAIKQGGLPTDAIRMDPDALPEIPAGPIADRLTIWPMEDGRYGLDATFHGATGHERVAQHEAALEGLGVKYQFRGEPDGNWTLRLGPLKATEVAQALAAFLY
ncbi:MAG TPA: hypothetical protein VID48_09275 [Solirubrobacteraceae bacterium]